MRGRSANGSVCGCSVFTLPNASRILPTLREEAPGERRERDVAFLDAHLLGTEGEEEVGARVRVDDRLERELRLLEAQRRLSAPGRRAHDAHEVADGRHVGVEDLRGCCTAAVDRERRCRSLAGGAGRHRGRGRRSLWCRRGGCRCFGHGLRRSFGRHRGSLGWWRRSVSRCRGSLGGCRDDRRRRSGGGRGALLLERGEPRLDRRDAARVLLPERLERRAQRRDLVGRAGGGFGPGRRRARRQRCRSSGCLRRVRARSRPSPLGRSGEHHSRRKRARDHPRAQPALPPTPRRTHGSLAIETDGRRPPASRRRQGGADTA